MPIKLDNKSLILIPCFVVARSNCCLNFSFVKKKNLKFLKKFVDAIFFQFLTMNLT